MRLPASVTTQPPEPINAPQPAATYVDPTEVADVPQAQVEHKPWWVRASSAIVNGAFTNVAAAFIAVTGAIYRDGACAVGTQSGGAYAHRRAGQRRDECGDGGDPCQRCNASGRAAGSCGGST